MILQRFCSFIMLFPILEQLCSSHLQSQPFLVVYLLPLPCTFLTLLLREVADSLRHSLSIFLLVVLAVSTMGHTVVALTVSTMQHAFSRIFPLVSTYILDLWIPIYECKMTSSTNQTRKLKTNQYSAIIPYN